MERPNWNGYGQHRQHTSQFKHPHVSASELHAGPGVRGPFPDDTVKPAVRHKNPLDQDHLLSLVLNGADEPISTYQANSPNFNYSNNLYSQYATTYKHKSDGNKNTNAYNNNKPVQNGVNNSAPQDDDYMDYLHQGRINGNQGSNGGQERRYGFNYMATDYNAAREIPGGGTEPIRKAHSRSPAPPVFKEPSLPYNPQPEQHRPSKRPQPITLEFPPSHPEPLYQTPKQHPSNNISHNGNIYDSQPQMKRQQQQPQQHQQQQPLRSNVRDTSNPIALCWDIDALFAEFESDIKRRGRSVSRGPSQQPEQHHQHHQQSIQQQQQYQPQRQQQQQQSQFQAQPRPRSVVGAPVHQSWTEQYQYDDSSSRQRPPSAGGSLSNLSYRRQATFDDGPIDPHVKPKDPSYMSVNLAKRSATPTFGWDPKQHGAQYAHFIKGSYVSPGARGLAPAPSDQPLRNPVRGGQEGTVDNLTIRLYKDMMGMHDTDYTCAKCGEGIGGGRPGCTALSQTYHLDCFTCNVCNSRLAGGSFYSVEGKPYCETDYMDTLEKCVVCQKPVTDRILRASGKPYHPNCFLCTACSKCLDGVPFTVDANNQVHCVECFHEKFAPRCGRCEKPIVPEDGKEESLRVVAMDKSYHVNCYTCEDCSLSLNSKIEGRGCYPLDSHILCKDCNIKRVQQQNS